MYIRSSSIRRISHIFNHSPILYRLSSTSSVSSGEVSHFNKLASTWWDPYGSSRLLHLMNPLRHDFISACLSSQSTPPPSHKLKYLDVGCGGGIFAESAARLAGTESVTALDPTPEVLKVAEEHARQDPMLHGTGRLRYLNKSIEDLPVPTSSKDQFDILALWEVIEHVNYPSSFLASCMPFVRPGGWLVLSTIARTWTSWLTTKVIAEDVTRIVPRGTHDWNKYINEEELRSFFKRQPHWATDGGIKAIGCIYVPGLGWRMATGGEQWGNYFFGVRKDPDPDPDS